MELEGRVALVTGAARRVGRAIALRLSAAGCHVAVHYRRSEQDALDAVAACRSCGVSAEAFRADLADVAAARGLVASVLGRFGRLDVLVNNASFFEPMTLDTFSVEEWERTLRVNLTAPLVLTQAARAALEEAGGRVVNLCDAGAHRAWPDYLAYVVSKAALESLTRVLARALAPRVNVVGIAPGVAAWPEHYTESVRAEMTARIPLRRAGTPEDMAAAVHYVLRDGDYVTGAILPVDGGQYLA